jgi:hypothetical protein
MQTDIFLVRFGLEMSDGRHFPMVYTRARAGELESSARVMYGMTSLSSAHSTAMYGIKMLGGLRFLELRSTVALECILAPLLDV